VGHPSTAPLVAAGSDLLGGLGLDELLERPGGELTDKIGAVSSAQRVEQLGQGRIGQSHRCDLLVVHLAYTPSITPVAHLMVDRPRNPTTWGDSYGQGGESSKAIIVCVVAGYAKRHLLLGHEDILTDLRSRASKDVIREGEQIDGSSLELRLTGRRGMLRQNIRVPFSGRIGHRSPGGEIYRSKRTTCTGTPAAAAA
jgi:hypothetical protein